MFRQDWVRRQRCLFTRSQRKYEGSMGESSQGTEMRNTIIKFGEGVEGFVCERMDLASLHSTDILRYDMYTSLPHFFALLGFEDSCAYYSHTMYIKSHIMRDPFRHFILVHNTLPSLRTLCRARNNCALLPRLEYPDSKMPRVST